MGVIRINSNLTAFLDQCLAQNKYDLPFAIINILLYTRYFEGAGIYR